MSEAASVAIPNPRDLAPPEALPMDLMVWDAPNVDMTLSGVIGRKATPEVRPRYDAVARWFMRDVGRLRAQAAVFANFAAGTAPVVRPWVEAVRGCGFDVFIKPKLLSEDDIDDAMVAHIDACTARPPGVRRLVIVSGDGRCFRDRAVELAGTGVEVVVVTFDEVGNWARAEPSLTFIDFESIKDAFLNPLPRVRLEELPAEGAWLPATKPLRAFAAEVAA